MNSLGSGWMKKTVGILAHVDAGKTTFCEQLLYHTNSIKKMGRVDLKTAHLDSHEIEKERGITIFSDVGIIHYKEDTYYLVDTPGHIDFSPEMERAIQVMDYAIIIISAIEGIEGHTETVWSLLRKYQVPTFFFINKTDRVGAAVHKVINDLRLTFTQDIYDITEFNLEDDELMEWIALKDDELLQDYLEGNIDKTKYKSVLSKMIINNQAFLCASGSALENNGIISFFDTFHQLTETNYNEQLNFKGRIFKIRHDDNKQKLSYIKVLTGKLTVKDVLSYQIDEDVTEEKVNQIRLYNGKDYQEVSSVKAGDICCVVGLKKAGIGTGLGCKSIHQYEINPTLTSKVSFDSTLNTKDILNAFQILEEEDPSLHVVWENHLKEIHIHVMGIIQLEVLEKVVFNRFGYEVQFAAPEILYKETITEVVYGYGHYEPLRHYAEVHLRIEPAPRGSGVLLGNECHPNALAIGIQNNILHYLIEKEHHGILTGSILTDVKITLVNGIFHEKHTTGGDFKEATLRALRQGLEKAKSQLLEPYYQVKIKIDINLVGRVLSDITKAKGTYEPPDIKDNKAMINGRVPVSTFMNYPTVLASFTQGKGMIQLQFSGYDICHNEEEVVEQKAYQKDSDIAYPSSSVFCAKGQSFVVKWNQAEDFMHGLK